jgi:hypothetical protein
LDVAVWGTNFRNVQWKSPKTWHQKIVNIQDLDKTMLFCCFISNYR